MSWRERFEIVPGQHKPNLVRTGAIFSAFAAIFLWIIYTKPSLPFFSGGGTKVVAEFNYGANIRPGYTPVRVGGVEVGQVDSVERAPSGRGVRVTFTIDNGKGVHLHSDATVNLQWRTLLGRNMFLNVHIGSPTAPPLDPKFIPRTRTTDQVELDTALEPLGPGGRVALQQVITGFGDGFNNPDAVRSVVRNAAPAMKPLGDLLEAFRGVEKGRDLPVLIASTSRALGALSARENDLAGLLDNGNVALAATAAHRADLAATVNTAPAALRQTRTTMSRLEGTLNILDPVARQLIPGVQELAPAAIKTRVALGAAIPLLRDLRVTFGDLVPAVADLDTTARNGVPAFKPLTSIINRTRTTYIPWLNAENPANHRPNYQNVGPAVASVGAATSFGDANGPVANFEAAAGENALVDSPCQTHLTDLKNPEGLVQCNELVQLITGLLTGVQPSNLNIPGLAAGPENAVDNLLRKGILQRRTHQRPIHLKAGAK